MITKKALAFLQTISENPEVRYDCYDEMHSSLAKELMNNDFIVSSLWGPPDEYSFEITRKGIAYLEHVKREKRDRFYSVVAKFYLDIIAIIFSGIAIAVSIIALLKTS